jgi:thiamine-phosphate pyrophosphorylase
LAALVRDTAFPNQLARMPFTPASFPRCSLYLITPLLSTADANDFAKVFAEVLDAAAVASALVRLAPSSESDAKAIVTPLLRVAVAADCALLIERDARLAHRLGADGVHVAGLGADLVAAIEFLKPNRIVGVGSLRLRDDAMTASELGADYVMFGESHHGARALDLGSLAERVSWWAEIFETPCVAYAEAISAASELARAGADFVALDEAIWSAVSPREAARQTETLIARVAAQIP